MAAIRARRWCRRTRRCSNGSPAACAVPSCCSRWRPSGDGAEAVISWAVRARHPGRDRPFRRAARTVVARAVAAGAAMSTHLGNGLPATLPKLDNPLMAQLAEDRLTAGFIADGVHLPVPALRVHAAGQGLGAFRAGDRRGRRRRGAAGTLPLRRHGDRRRRPTAPCATRPARWPARRCGWTRRWPTSSRWGICDLAQAVALASRNPAALLGRDAGRHRHLERVGRRARLPAGRHRRCGRRPA